MTLRSIPLDILNSATKYPSIETYHVLDSRGRLTDERRDPPAGAEIHITEKIDGTNGRIVVIGGDYVIGSRNEMLSAKGDHVFNPAMGIVEALRPVARCISMATDACVTFYFEVYGHRIGKAAGEYTSTDKVDVRLFDVAVVDEATLRSPTADLAAVARDNGGQMFHRADSLYAWARSIGVRPVPTLVRDTIPTARADVLAWLPGPTCAGLDAEGAAEGVVMRTADRSWIVKARREDYARSDQAAPRYGKAAQR